MVKQDVDGRWRAECPICGHILFSYTRIDAQTALKEHINNKHRAQAPPKLPPDNLIQRF